MIVSLPRALSKLGYCSRTYAKKLIQNGNICVNGKIVKDIYKRVDLNKDKITVNNKDIIAAKKIYIALNKPRGLITTLSDEKNRDTIFKCFENFNLPYVFPVGRLDKASEGLLLLTNDTVWANKTTSPENKLEKTYHVQINKIIDDEIITKLENGIVIDGELLKAKQVKIVRTGKKNCWVEIVLDEGKNREIRRMFSYFKINVLRLIRIAIGSIILGNLEKGKFRYLTEKEINSI